MSDSRTVLVRTCQSASACSCETFTSAEARGTRVEAFSAPTLPARVNRAVRTEL